MKIQILGVATALLLCGGCEKEPVSTAPETTNTVGGSEANALPSEVLAEESPESKAQSQRKAYPNLSITIRNKDGVIENLNLKKWRRSFCNYGVAGQNKTTVSIDIPEADYESLRKMVVAMLKLKQPLHRDAEVVVSVRLLASPGEYEHWGIDRNSHTFGYVPGDSGEIERIYTATTKLLDKHRVLQNKNSEQDSGGKGEGRP